MKIKILRQYIYLSILITRLGIVFLCSCFNTQNSRSKNLISFIYSRFLQGFYNVGDNNGVGGKVDRVDYADGKILVEGRINKDKGYYS